MNWKLFIDDERVPVHANDWLIARNSTHAFLMCTNQGMPSEIAFDHDLGGEDTSIIFLKMLTDYMLDYKIKFPKNFVYSIHSQNPIGASNIKSRMDSLIKELGYVE